MLQKIGRLSVLWNIYRQKLKEDLSRYGIQAVIVNEYNQMTEILKTIECSVKKEMFLYQGVPTDMMVSGIRLWQRCYQFVHY